MKRLIAVFLIAAVLLLGACQAQPARNVPSAPATVPETTAATTVPVETTVPVTTAPPETTVPVETTVPETTAPEATEPLPEISDVKFKKASEIGYTLAEIPVADETGDSELGVIAGGRAVVITGRGEGWLRVRYQKKTGYVPEKAVSDQRPQGAIAASEACGGTVYPGDHRIVAIDPGHQNKSMPDKEPNGPGSDVMKKMLSAGTSGVVTDLAEYQLNLKVALLLRDELISRGYTVVMIRESNDVTISNAQRAIIANKAGAGAFVRIHANGSSDPERKGAYTICQTSQNPYNAHLHDESFRLSKLILKYFIPATGMDRLPLRKVDDMTGLNWAEVPSTIIEMGYMSNAGDDEKMATTQFQKNAAKGIANGLDAYFEET